MSLRRTAAGVLSASVRSALPIEAGILQAQRDDNLVLIESTSNQVNQFGGYTGQTPAQFASFVREIAACMNFPAERIVLAGDHLGPHPWRPEGPSSAMAKATALARACVLAGYTTRLAG